MYCLPYQVDKYAEGLKMAHERVEKLKAAIQAGCKNPVEYHARLKARSEKLTNEIVKAGEVPRGQGCAYPGGYPV